MAGVVTLDTLVLPLGEMLAGAHGNLLEHPEKDRGFSPPWVPGAAPGEALVWLMGKDVWCLRAVPEGQAGAKASTGTEPLVSAGKRGWGLRGAWGSACSAFGFRNQSVAGGRNVWSQCCWGPSRREILLGLKWKKTPGNSDVPHVPPEFLGSSVSGMETK